MGDAKMLRLEDDTSGEYDQYFLLLIEELRLLYRYRGNRRQRVAFALERPGVDAIVIRLKKWPLPYGYLQKWLLRKNFSQERGECSGYIIRTVSSVTTAGLGERVCVDATERLSDGEEFSLAPPHHAFV